MKKLFDKYNFQKGYPIFGFYIPGIVYLLDGISPGVPLYLNEDNDCRAIQHFKISGKPPVVILSEKRPITKEVLKSLRDVNILFPEEYLLIGEVSDPAGILFKVYFPKTIL